MSTKLSGSGIVKVSLEINAEPDLMEKKGFRHGVCTGQEKNPPPPPRPLR